MNDARIVCPACEIPCTGLYQRDSYSQYRLVAMYDTKKRVYDQDVSGTVSLSPFADVYCETGKCHTPLPKSFYAIRQGFIIRTDDAFMTELL